MEEIIPKPKNEKQSSPADRVSLDEKSLNQIDGWIKQITEKRKSIHPSRKEMVNWRIQRSSLVLSKAEEESLIEQFYDAERVLKEALKETRLAKARGEKPDLKEIMGTQIGSAPKTPTDKKISSVDSTAQEQKVTPKGMKNSGDSYGQPKLRSN